MQRTRECAVACAMCVQRWGACEGDRAAWKQVCAEIVQPPSSSPAPTPASLRARWAVDRCLCNPITDAMRSRSLPPHLCTTPLQFRRLAWLLHAVQSLQPYMMYARRYPTKGAEEGDREALAAPIDGRVFWAGEAANVHMNPCVQVRSCRTVMSADVCLACSECCLVLALASFVADDDTMRHAAGGTAVHHHIKSRVWAPGRLIHQFRTHNIC